MPVRWRAYRLHWLPSMAYTVRQPKRWPSRPPSSAWHAAGRCAVAGSTHVRCASHNSCTDGVAAVRICAFANGVAAGAGTRTVGRIADTPDSLRDCAAQPAHAERAQLCPPAVRSGRRWPAASVCATWLRHLVSCDGFGFCDDFVADFSIVSWLRIGQLVQKAHNALVERETKSWHE